MDEAAGEAATCGAALTSVVLRDAAGQPVASATGPDGALRVPAARAWRPGDPYLYRLDVRHGPTSTGCRSGIRTVRAEAGRLLLNGAPVRLRGFGLHEDGTIRGKGHDDARMVRDFALLDWIGANSFRTSHYPYAEEVLDYADRRGLLVIDEAPAVGLHLSLGNMGDARRPHVQPGPGRRGGRRGAPGRHPRAHRAGPQPPVRDRLVDRERARHRRARRARLLRAAGGRGARAGRDPADLLRQRGHRPAGHRRRDGPVRPDLREPILRLVRRPR